MLRWGVTLFWTACLALVLLGAVLAAVAARAAFRADRERRALFRQELIWILAPALLVVGLGLASDRLPSLLRPLPAMQAR
jgi:hypothetical protein